MLASPIVCFSPHHTPTACASKASKPVALHLHCSMTRTLPPDDFPYVVSKPAGGKELVKRLTDHITTNHDTHNILLVTGEEGAGKTGIILDTLRELKASPTSFYIIHHNIGQLSTDCLPVLRSLCIQLERLQDSLIGGAGTNCNLIWSLMEF